MKMTNLLFVPLDSELPKQRLFDLGHFNHIRDFQSTWNDIRTVDRHSSDFKEAVRSFQSFTGLQEDGELGAKTMHALATGISPDGGVRLCGCPDIEWMYDGTEEANGVVNVPNGTRSWPDHTDPITFAINFRKLPGLGSDKTRAAFQQALDEWNKNTDLNLRLGDWSDADVQIGTKNHRGGTLAVALLSLGRRGVGSHWQNYDISNREWWYGLLLDTVIHETGHTLGFSHGKTGIMKPTATGRMNKLQREDLDRAHRIYGDGNDKRIPVPPPQDPEDPGSLEGFIKLTAGGKTYFFNMSGETAE